DQRPEEIPRHPTIKRSLLCIPSELVFDPAVRIGCSALTQRAGTHLLHHGCELLAVEMLRQRLAHLAVLLDDLLERLAEVIAGARIISLKRLCSADIAPGDGFDGLGHCSTSVPKSVGSYRKQVYGASQRT